MSSLRPEEEEEASILLSSTPRPPAIGRGEILLRLVEGDGVNEAAAAHSNVKDRKENNGGENAINAGAWVTKPYYSGFE